ncbi:ISPsy20, transposase IstB, partial [Pseudomonas syringae pv. primulae]
AECRVHRGPGTGKTHLASALAVSGITAHNKRVRFFSTVDLVNLLEREKYDGKAGRIAQALLRTDLVILDRIFALQPKRWRPVI